MDTTAADTAGATDAVLVQLYTQDDLLEARRALNTTWTPWPPDATPMSVADSLRQARAASYIPERGAPPSRPASDDPFTPPKRTAPRRLPCQDGKPCGPCICWP